jgi:hypothetical protein
VQKTWKIPCFPCILTDTSYAIEGVYETASARVPPRSPIFVLFCIIDTILHLHFQIANKHLEIPEDEH